MRNALLPLCFLALALPASPEAKSDKFAIFVTGGDAAVPVVQSLIKKLNESKPFEAVTKNDSSKVIVLVSCMEPARTGLLLCMYVSHFNGPSFKTMLGAGNFVAQTADAVALNFLGAIAQDIVERYDDTNTENLRQALESCLLMTDSKCNVPGPLQKEFGEKQLTLGQYILKKQQ
jgi:hypothetical protein